MTTFARIENGVVCELFATDADISELFSHDLLWVDTAGQNVEVGDSYADCVFTKAIPLAFSRQQIEDLRLQAYANPLSGSDRYFAEAARLQAIGAAEEAIKSAQNAGIARYSEIQAQLPWPDA